MHKVKNQPRHRTNCGKFDITLHLVLTKIEQVAWLQSFQASVTPVGDIRLVQSTDSGYERTSECDRDHRVFTHSGGRDFEKRHPSDQRSGPQ